MTINQQETISAFLYDNNNEMEKDAGYISLDGFEYNKEHYSAVVDWVAPPHFYKMDNIIVLYCGKDEAIINSLEEIMGDQFAGDFN